MILNHHLTDFLLQPRCWRKEGQSAANLIMELWLRSNTLSVTQEKKKLSFYLGHKGVFLSLRKFLEAKSCNKRHQDWTLRKPG